MGTATDGVNNAHLKEIDDLLEELTENPDEERFFYWIIKIGVNESLVSDGAVITTTIIKDMLTCHWPFALSSEFKVTTISRPSEKEIIKATG